MESVYLKRVFNISDLVFLNAAANPNKIAYRFINSDGSLRILTNGQLANEVAKLAYLIEKITHPDDRVILGARPGLEYIISFYACLRVGVIAVPVFPPLSRAMAERFIHILKDTEPQLVVCDSETIKKLKKGMVVNNFIPKSMKSIVGISEEIDDLLHYLKVKKIQLIASEERVKSPKLVQSDELRRKTTPIAFLQYTSGSTGTPKGVMLSHSNLLDNFEVIRKALRHHSESHKFSWLPPYHDMGLIAGILEPLYVGFPSTLMSTIDFISNPMKWLHYVSEYRCTSTGAPNFAFELCIKHASGLDISTLDLSRVEVIANGAEPINPETISRFYRTFIEAGLKRGAIFPCYGLAEATVMVTAKPILQPEKILSLDTAALVKNKAVLSDQPNSIKIVSSGVPQMMVKIINESTKSECKEGEVGEIWVQGKSIAQGYYHKDKETKRSFDNKIDEQAPPFLSTGDLGFIYDNELFVCGRIKDLIIINGQNFYPHDLEQQVVMSSESIRQGCVIAYSEIKEGKELVSIVCELKSTEKKENYQVLAEKIQQSLSYHFNLQAHNIYFIPPKTIPKTTSGKLQRRLCSEKIAQHTLTILCHHQTNHPIMPQGSNETCEDAKNWFQQLNRLKPEFRHSFLCCQFQEEAAKILELRDIGSVPLDKGFFELGFDSIKAIQFKGRIEQELGESVAIDADFLFNYPSIKDAVSALLKQLFPGPSSSSLSNMDKKASPNNGFRNEDIAVIGMSCVFPGASNINEFWENLLKGHDSITEIPISRFDVNAYYSPIKGQKGKICTRKGGFIDHIDHFDADFFNISPKEAEFLDPQQRLLLKQTWLAFENANINVTNLVNSDTGVFIGLSTHDYEHYIYKNQDPEVVNPYFSTGNSASTASGRLSYFFGLQGPCFGIDTACSSSLAAIDEACMRLQNGACSLAVAGGVNAILCPELYISFSQAGMLSPDGACKSFDANADGYVRGEGCGVIILKRLSDALQDGDSIVAVIKASSIDHDGRSSGLTVPNGQAQQRLIRQTLEKSGLKSSDIHYIECHGTGTSLGDPIEVNAIKESFSDEREDLLFLGSVKANIGHLEAAAGIAGFIKVVLCLKHRIIPPQIHFDSLNPKIKLSRTMQINTQARTIDLNKKFIAGVSSFGFSGTNAHIIVEEPPVIEHAEPQLSTCYVLPVSAQSKESLKRLQKSYSDYCMSHPEVNIAELCYTASVGRAHLSHRLAVSGRSASEIANKLQLIKTYGKVNSTHHNIAFLFSGQGAQYFGMGKELYQNHPVFRHYLDEAALILKKYLEVPLFDILWQKQDLIHVTLYMQPSLLALEYALFKLWESWGVTPSYVMGCGLGEYVAAIAAGIMSFEDGLFLITKQAQLIQGLKADGEMALFEEFTQWVREISFRSPQINFVSSLTGEMMTAAPTAKYWVDHLLHTVQFESGIHTLIREGCSVFIEVGPHPILLEPARQCARDTPGLIWTGSLKKQVHDSEAIAEDIAELYNNGFDFAWTCFYKDSYHSKMDLPGYIFDKQSHWLAAVDIPQSEESLDQEWFYQVKWQANKLNKENVAPLQGRWLLLDLDKSLISKKLYHSLKNTGVDCTLATHAQHFNQKGKQWALDYGNKEQINHLIEEVLAQGTLNKIIFAIGTTELAEQEQKIKHYILGMLFLIQALITKKQKPEIWIITQGAQTIGSMSSLAASPLLGLRKVIAFEHPEFSIRTIDLDINTLSEQTILSEIALNRNEEQVAYRDTQRYVPRLTHAMQPPMVSQVIDPQASYLISGGGSGVGFEIAGWLVEKGAKHVTLMSRRGISEEAMEKVMLWKSNNISITVCGVDVGDYSQLTEVIRAYGTKLPPLKGIIHAAGALEDGLLLNNNWSHFEKVLQGKQKGAWYLHELSKMMTLDFFVLFSSMVSITGSIGQGNYVAANTYLDHLAYYRRSLNLPATSIQWGPWDEVGMASRRMQDNKDNPFYIQIRPMLLKKCLNMMNALLSYQGNIMVADLESSAFKTAFNSISNQSFISQLILENDAHGEKGEFQKNQFASLSHMEQLVSIQKILLQMISRILKKDKEFIAVDESLYNFGTDSLMQTQFLLEIKNYFGQDLKITLADLHHNFNISALSDLLISRIDIKSKVDVDHLNTHNLDTSCFPLVPHQIEMVDYIKSFPYNRAYHIPFFFKMSGLMPVDKADKALNTLVKNNEILRASIFSLYGQHYHRVHNEIIFRSKTFEITSSQLGEAMVSAYNEPFSLESPPLFRCYIYHVDNRYTVVGLVFCHVICDGMSTISFFKEFINLYDNPDKANTPVPVQFRSYVGWLMQDIYPKIDNELKQFWQDKLQGYDYLHVIEGKPINAIVEPEALPLHGEKTGFSLSQASLAKLEAYAARHSVTLGCLLQAVIHRALAEVSNKADTVVMVFCSGRNLNFQKNIIGPLVQHPLIRCKQIHARPLAEMAQYIREELIETSEYQYMPHFKLKEFQIKSAPVSLDYQYYDLSDLEERFELVSMPDVTIDLWGNDPRHLSFKVYVYAHNKVDFSLKYRPDIYSLEQAKMILGKCKEIISQDLVLN